MGRSQLKPNEHEIEEKTNHKIIDANDLVFSVETKTTDTQKIRYKGYTFHYRYFGKSTLSTYPILMLSGAFQNMESWKRFADFFETKTEVLLTDLPGTGQSDPITETTPIDFQSDCVAYLMEKLNIKKVNIIATSYGSPIAHRLAQLYPNKINSLVLAGTMKEVPQSKRADIQESIRLIEDDATKFAEKMVSILMAQQEFKWVNKNKLAKRVLYTVCKGLTDREKHHYIINTKRLLNLEPLDLSIQPVVSTLVFTGEYDPFTRPEYCRDIAQSFQRAMFTTIKGADHLFHMEQFEVTLNLLYRFFMPLDEVEGIHSIEIF